MKNISKELFAMFAEAYPASVNCYPNTGGTD